MTLDNKKCKECHKVRAAKCFYRDKTNPDGLRGKCKRCLNKLHKEWARANPDKMNLYHLRSWRKKKLRDLGMTSEDFGAMVHKQHGKCEICWETPKQALCVDHCHETGKIRALLCKRCNLAIGLLKDSPSVALRAHKYLTKHLS